MTDDGGLYIAVFVLAEDCRIRVGRLGGFALPAGWYYYVGSARRNRSARLARHARRRKKRRWHIDALSTRARMLGAVLVDADSRTECGLAAELAKLLPRAVPGFGASDCRCGGHLFRQVDGDRGEKLMANLRAW